MSLAHFQKRLHGRKSLQRGLCLNITVVRNVDRHQALRLSPPSWRRRSRTQRKRDRSVRVHYFLAFVTMSHLVFLLKFAFIFYTNLSRIWGVWQAILKIKNKNKDSGENFKYMWRGQGSRIPQPLTSSPILLQVCLKSGLDLGGLFLSQYFHHHQLVKEWEKNRSEIAKKRKKNCSVKTAFCHSAKCFFPNILRKLAWSRAATLCYWTLRVEVSALVRMPTTPEKLVRCDHSNAHSLAHRAVDTVGA